MHRGASRIGEGKREPPGPNRSKHGSFFFFFFFPFFFLDVRRVRQDVPADVRCIGHDIGSQAPISMTSSMATKQSMGHDA